MLRIRSLYLSALIFILSNTVYSQDFFGLWNGSLDTFTFRPLDGNGVGMVVVTSDGYQDIYTGTFDGPNFSVCTFNEPFNACYAGTVNSETSLSLTLESCEESASSNICPLLQDDELSREIYYDANGIFLVSDGNYFMVEDAGGLITAHQLYLEEGKVDGFSGTRAGNSGSVTPFDDSGPYLDFELLSNNESIVTVTRCNLCSAEDEAKTPVGTTLTLTRVTN